MLRTLSFISLLLCVLLFSTCSPRPDGVLSARQMEKVLYDIHRADGILYVKGYGHRTDETTAKYYEVVLQKHGVTQAQFDSSLVWYTDNPKRFDKIYPKVMARLTEEKEWLAAYNDQLSDPKEKCGQKDTAVSTRPVRSCEEWKQILRNGLPLEWGIDSIVIDTAFVYPYLHSLQDSIQLTLFPDSVPNQEPIDSIPHQQVSLKDELSPSDPLDKPWLPLQRLSPEQAKRNLIKSRNIRVQE